MSRITDYILEPKVVYTEGGFLVRVKVQDDYKYKKYIVSENLHYKTVQGTSFTLTDADSTKQASITELKGNTTQEGTPTPSSPVEVKTVSGDNNIVIQNKNLFEIETPDYVAHNAWDGYGNGTYTQLDNGYEFLDRFRAIAFEFDNLTVGEKYTLSFNVVATSNVTCGIGQNKYRGNTETSSNKNYSVTTTTSRQFFTFTATTTNRLAFNSGNVTPNTITITDIQLEKGEQNTTYLVHQENSYRVDLKGKNLFNDILRQGVTTYNTGNYGTNNARITSTDWIKNVKAGTYTISAKTSTTKTLQVSMVTFDTNGTFYNVSDVSGQWKTMPFAFTIPVDMQLKCNIRYSNDSGITPSEVTEVQLESGTQATPYEPYYEYELNKIGNYQDKLYYNSGKWYIEKNIGKVVLDGSENWNSASSVVSGASRFYFEKSGIISSSGVSNTNFYSDKFKGLNWEQIYSGDTTTLNGFCVYGYSSPQRIHIRIDNTYANSVSTFKTWLSNNNTTVYYVLATPTYTEITDTYLLEQLNNILDIELYEDLCYVDWIGIEKPTMTLQYSGTEDLGNKFIITEDGKKFRTDWRKLGRRKNGR